MSNSTGSSKGDISGNLPVGAIFAGGASRRMGTDKSMIILGGKPLLDRVIDSIAAQVASVVIIGGPAGQAGDRAVAHRADSVSGGRGPLAGLLAAMEYASEIGSSAEFVFVTATDMPFLPADLVARLASASREGLPVIPRSGGRLQPLAALWPRAFRSRLASGLSKGSIESMKDLYEKTGFVEVQFDDGPLDPFFNVNTLEDLGIAERRPDLPD